MYLTIVSCQKESIIYGDMNPSMQISFDRVETHMTTCFEIGGWNLCRPSLCISKGLSYLGLTIMIGAPVLPLPLFSLMLAIGLTRDAMLRCVLESLVLGKRLRVLMYIL
jgi:hypothetical protein